MPELPEVEIVKKSLSKFSSKKIVNVEIFNNKLRYTISNEIKKKLTNQKILKITRKSKYIIFFFKAYFLLVHLGMTGKFYILRNKDKKKYITSFYYKLEDSSKHDHICFKLSNNFSLIYNDIRKFGFIKLYKKCEIKKINFLAKLGPEPISKYFNIKYFKNFIKKRNKNIKSLLMDQTFVAGLGNIYVNESLFLSKIHPLKSCSDLTIIEIKKLIYNIKRILKLSIKNGGSSIRNFQNADSVKGSFQQFFNVYGKNDNKCSRKYCNGKIKRLIFSNRSCFYCNKCQTL